MDIGAAANQVAEQIATAGVPAVVDPRNLELPGAWVTPGEISLAYLDGDTADMNWDVYLIAPDNGTPDALDALGSMLAKLATPLGVQTATPLTVNLTNHGADPMPALLITIQTTITKDTP